MMNIRRIATLIIFTVSSVQAATPPTPPAQPATAGALTLVSALKLGLDYSPDIKSAASQVKGAADATAKAKGLIFPTITGVASATNSQNSTTFTTASAPSTGSATGDTYSVAVNLSQPIYAGGAITSGLDYYKAGEDVSQQNYFNVKQTLILNLLTAYYALAQAQESLAAAESNRDILKSYTDITSYYERIGRSRKIDLMQAQVNWSLALSDVETDQVALKTAIANMNHYLGESNDHPVRADFKVSVSPVGPITLDQAYDAGVKNNPVIRSAVIALEQVQYTEDIDLAQDLPSLSLVGSEGFKSPDTGSLWYQSSNQYSIGLNLTVPIFTGFSSFAKRSGYEEQKYQAEKAIQIAKDNMRNSLQNDIAAIRSAQLQLNLAVASVKQSRTALELANKAYRQGTASSLDVINMQNVRYSSEKLFVSSQYAYLQALLNLRQQMGIDLEKAYEH